MNKIVPFLNKFFKEFNWNPLEIFIHEQINLMHGVKLPENKKGNKCILWNLSY